MNDAHGKIDASPTKAFFIDMLTRDITLTECILDLVDNCIHNVIRSTNLDVTQVLTGKARARKLSHAKITITFDKTHFQIEDTCGGISIDDARKEVFRFGKPAHDRNLKGLGVYGIGMKRALFKIGDDITVRSRTSREKEGFAVAIDVREWMKKPKEWTFEFTSPGPRRRTSRSARPGTKITIRNLRPVCGRRFSDIAFEDALIEKIGKTFCLFLKQGVEILVNKRTAKPDLPQFARSRSLAITKQQYKYDGVDIVIMLGVTPKDDHNPRGWYVFCNGRMVLEADKSETTGWYKGKTKWNPKHNHFFGQVHFASKNVTALPWRTTKEGVEEESPVYQFALGKMRTLARPVQIYLRDSYEAPVEGASHREVLDGAKGVSLLAIAKNADSLFEVNLPKKRKTVDVSIQYSRPRSQVKKIAAALKKPKLSGTKVGEYTFDYFLENMCK